MLAEQGLEVSYETIRRWFLKFGTVIAANLCRTRMQFSMTTNVMAFSSTAKVYAADWVAAITSSRSTIVMASKPQTFWHNSQPIHWSGVVMTWSSPAKSES